MDLCWHADRKNLDNRIHVRGGNINLGITSIQVIKQVTQVDKLTWIPRRETGGPEKAFTKMHWCSPKKGSEKEVGKEAEGPRKMVLRRMGDLQRSRI